MHIGTNLIQHIYEKVVNHSDLMRRITAVIEQARRQSFNSVGYALIVTIDPSLKLVSVIYNSAWRTLFIKFGHPLS